MYVLDLDMYPCWIEEHGGPLSVGYLDSQFEYTQGDVSNHVKDILRERIKNPDIRTRGFHICPFCHDATSSTDFYVDSTEGKRYISPYMILHYIEKHGYKPPDEYIEALLSEIDA